MAYWTFGQLLGLLLAEFQPEQIADLDKEVTEEMLVFHRVSDEERRATGRNDPCPCGSGRKFKACHLGLLD